MLGRPSLIIKLLDHHLVVRVLNLKQSCLINDFSRKIWGVSHYILRRVIYLTNSESIQSHKIEWA